MNFAVLPPEAPAATDAIYQLLAVLADRAKTKAALAKVVAARDEAQAAAEKFGDLQIERAAVGLLAVGDTVRQCRRGGDYYQHAEHYFRLMSSNRQAT